MQSSNSPRKLILKSFLSPGDILMLTAAVRDLHLTYPGLFLTDVRTACGALWENNPYLSSLSESDPDVEEIACDYPLIHSSNQLPYHFIHGYRLYLNEKLKIDIKPHAFHGDIHLTAEEKAWISQVDEMTGVNNTPFWIIVAGGKSDFTAKWWESQRYQQVVDHFQDKLLFVQCGSNAPGHTHPKLRGVINLVGKTDLRQMVRLMYHARGVICPITMFMHLAAAVESKTGTRAHRPCVVIAGGREPATWESYPSHQFLHRCGCLPCCESGGCWKSRVVRLGDGDLHDNVLCEYPIVSESKQIIPKCMDLISPAEVISAVERYLEYDRYPWKVLHQYRPDDLPITVGPTIANGTAEPVPDPHQRLRNDLRALLTTAMDQQ